jgi:hypothetical protein
MTYNIGEKPGKGSYLCPKCGCRVGEMTMLARREVSSLGTDTTPPIRDVNPAHAWRSTNTVKSLSPHLVKLKSVALTLVLAGLMFASGFVTKTLLATRTPIESPRGSSANPSAGETSLNVNRGKAGINPADASVSVGNPSVTVWVNTTSGVYHCSNTRWYGNTKSGQYMTQKEAQSKGYRPAHGSACV